MFIIYSFIYLLDYQRLSISEPNSVTNVTVPKGEKAVLPCRRTSSKVKLRLSVLSTDEEVRI